MGLVNTRNYSNSNELKRGPTHHLNTILTRLGTILAGTDVAGCNSSTNLAVRIWHDCCSSIYLASFCQWHYGAA